MYLKMIYCFSAYKDECTRNVYCTTKAEAEKERLLWQKRGYEVSRIVYDVPLTNTLWVGKKGGSNE